MINSSDKIKLSFNSMDDFLMELQDYKSSNDDINTFSIIGDRGYGKSTVLQYVYNSFSDCKNKSDLEKSSCTECSSPKTDDCRVKNCTKKSGYVTLQIINPDHLKSPDLMSWLIGSFENIVKDMKKIWSDMPICKKNICNSQIQKFLIDEKRLSKIDTNEQRKFFLEEWYDDLITDCYKRSNEYKDSVLKQFKENFEYKEKYKKILSSDSQFKDKYDEFVRCLMLTYKSMKGLDEIPKLLILIDDLDIHPKYAYDMLIDTCIMLNNGDTVIVIAGNLEGFTQSVKATLYDEYMSDVQLGLVNNNSREFEVRKEYLDQLSRNTINKALPISKRYFLNGIDNVSAFIPISKKSNDTIDQDHRSFGNDDVSELSKIDNLELLIKKTIAVDNDDTLLNLFHNSPRKLSSLYEILEDIKEFHTPSANKKVQIDAPKYFNNMTKLLRYDTSVIDDNILSIMANSLKHMSTSGKLDKSMSSRDFTTTLDSISNYYTTLRDNYSDSNSINKILVSFTDVLMLYICWIYYINSNNEYEKVDSSKNILELITIVSEIMNTNVLPKRSVLPTRINPNKDKEAFKLYLKIYIANTVLAIDSRSTNFFNDDESSYEKLRKSQLFFDLIFLKSRKEYSEDLKVDKILDLNRYNIRNISIVDEINECLKLDESEIKEAVKTLHQEIIGLSSNKDMFNVLVQLKSRYISEKFQDVTGLLENSQTYLGSKIDHESFTYNRLRHLDDIKNGILRVLKNIEAYKILNESKIYEIEVNVKKCHDMLDRLQEIIEGIPDLGNHEDKTFSVSSIKIPDAFKGIFDTITTSNIEIAKDKVKDADSVSSLKKHISSQVNEIKNKLTISNKIESNKDFLSVVELFDEELVSIDNVINDLIKNFNDKLNMGNDVLSDDIKESYHLIIEELSEFSKLLEDIGLSIVMAIDPTYSDMIQSLKELSMSFIHDCCRYQDFDNSIMNKLNKRYISNINRYNTFDDIIANLYNFSDSLIKLKGSEILLSGIYGQIMIDVFKKTNQSYILSEKIDSEISNLNEIINFTNKYMACLIIDEQDLKSVVNSNPNFEISNIDLDLVDELNKVKYSVSSKLSDVISIMDNLINYTDPIYADRIRYVIRLYLSGLNLEENISAISNSRYAEMLDRVRTSIDKPNNYDLASIRRLENIPYDLDFSNDTENDISNGTKFFDAIIKLISEAIKNRNLDVEDKNVNDKADVDSQENHLESDGINEQKIEESTS